MTNGLAGAGDAQVFTKTASYNFDVERFFTKWLHDLAADQMENGAVGHVVPDYLVGGNAVPPGQMRRRSVRGRSIRRTAIRRS